MPSAFIGAAPYAKQYESNTGRATTQCICMPMMTTTGSHSRRETLIDAHGNDELIRLADAPAIGAIRAHRDEPQFANKRANLK